jgi:hypothetical protein
MVYKKTSSPLWLACFLFSERIIPPHLTGVQPPSFSLAKLFCFAEELVSIALVDVLDTRISVEISRSESTNFRVKVTTQKLCNTKSCSFCITRKEVVS